MREHDTAPTPRELEVLKVLWELGEATVRDVYETMRERQGLAQNTVQTFLRTMEQKGLVRHRTEGRAFVYRPRYSRERTLSRFLDHVFDGAVDQLVMSLLRVKKLSAGEIEQIEQMIERAKQPGPKR